MNIDERLWEYIDGTATPEEKTAVEQLIASQQEWRLKYQELQEVHQLLNNHLELDEPSMRFRQNVMEAITQYHIAPATKSYIDKRIIYGIGAFFIAMIGGLLIYMLSQLNWANTGSGNNLLPAEFTSISWSKFFSSSYTSAFIIINTVLGLMLLDMWLGKKRRALKDKKM
jgi:hypothetical protein